MYEKEILVARELCSAQCQIQRRGQCQLGGGAASKVSYCQQRGPVRAMTKNEPSMVGATVEVPSRGRR
ncbi:hypothetical protein [Pandoravirus japonicus]|uniref:Uncharacterized protein n=1 Tax=Pandoravirus japonicus TaxID=2823154 RepID=A0A811BTJ4_9VIRU|nr:hypothetical protein [Pandoravirus japonicus]